MTEKKPYDLQRIYAEKAGDPFDFTWADRVWTLPNMRMLDIEVQERIENLNTAAATAETIFVLFDEMMGEEQGQQWRNVRPRPLPMIFDLFEAWLEHSKAELGESAASDGSSKSTGRPSKRTSNASTASGSAKRSSPRARKTATPRANSSSVSAG
jgi:hypothetical protein